MIPPLAEVHGRLIIGAYLRGEHQSLRDAHGYEVLIDAGALDEFGERTCLRALQQIRASCTGLSLHAPFSDLLPGASDSAIRRLSLERLSAAARLAADIGARTLVVHTGYVPQIHGMQLYRRSWIDNTANALEPILRILETAHTRLALENVIEPDPAPLLELADALDHPQVGICLDVGHAQIFGTAPPAHWIEHLGNALCELHLHDNDGTTDWHAACGTGHIDWASICRALGQQRCAPGQEPLWTFEMTDPQRVEHSYQYLARLCSADSVCSKS